MKHLIIVLFFFAFTLSAFSQTQMLINLNNGTTDSISISSIKNITFKISSLPIPTNGLVAWYPFNGNANDSSGNGNNGTVHNATLSADRFNNPNSAYSFNGSSSYIKRRHSILSAQPK